VRSIESSDIAAASSAEVSAQTSAPVAASSTAIGTQTAAGSAAPTRSPATSLVAEGAAVTDIANDLNSIARLESGHQFFVLRSFVDFDQF
jgi:cell division septation protein DedD